MKSGHAYDGYHYEFESDNDKSQHSMKRFSASVQYIWAYDKI